VVESRSSFRHRRVPAWSLYGSGATAQVSNRGRGGFRERVAIDLGTVNTLVAVFGRGLMVDEPSAVAFDQRTGAVVAVGRAAEEVAGRELKGIEVVHPLREGVVTDLEAAAAMLGGFLRRVCRDQRLARADIAVCIPAGATGVERRGLLATIEQEVRPSRAPVVVEEPLAAALGACGTEEGARMVVDIGGGTTEVGAIMTCGTMLGAVRTSSIRVAGNAMDAAIVDAITRQLGLRVSLRTAERLKMALGGDGEADRLSGIGADGTPRTEQLSPALLREALRPCQQKIIEAVAGVFAGLPPDASDAVFEEGIWLTGGGAKLAGMRELIADRTGVETRIAPDPLRCVLRGLGIVLGQSMETSNAA
jgi:rod shape-determining protein MreB